MGDDPQRMSTLSRRQKNATEDDGASDFHCLELFGIPPALAVEQPDDNNPDSARSRGVEALIKTSKKGPFEDNALAHKAEITWLEQGTVISILMVVMGGPLLWFMLVVPCTVLFGSATQLGVLFLATVGLAFHPLPRVNHPWLRASFISFALYKYFSYRFCWKGDARQKAQSIGPWLGAGVPHGVLPFANVLCMLGMNSFSFLGVPFLAAPASVVYNTPFLRYLLLLGPSCNVSAGSMGKQLAQGKCIGLVPDGIAGIFKCNEDDEVITLKSRKGLAKLALRTGAAIIPAYSLGNTAAFSAWFDRWGLMERASRKLHASLFLYWGRFYLPIPHRTPITMLVGDPVLIPNKVENPTQAQIDQVHQLLLDRIEEVFDAHKGALGWGHKKIKFV